LFLEVQILLDLLSEFNPILIASYVRNRNDTGTLTEGDNGNTVPDFGQVGQKHRGLTDQFLL
jgi:hypothetical protein